jgi:hypothetical protein
MTHEEAQQEQTLAEIRAIRNGGEYPREYYREAIDKALVLIHSQAQKIAEQEKELKLLRYVLEAEKTARIYEDGTGAAGEALFHARKELEEWDAKTDSKEVAR